MEYDYDNLRTLLNAVVELAAVDYLNNLCKLHDAEVRLLTETSQHVRDTINNEISHCQYELCQLDEFFLGPNFNGFTELSGEYLIKMLKQHVEDFEYDPRKMKKERARYEALTNSVGGLTITRRGREGYKAFSR